MEVWRIRWEVPSRMDVLKGQVLHYTVLYVSISLAAMVNLKCNLLILSFFFSPYLEFSLPPPCFLSTFNVEILIWFWNWYDGSAEMSWFVDWQSNNISNSHFHFGFHMSVHSYNTIKSLQPCWLFEAVPGYRGGVKGWPGVPLIKFLISEIQWNILSYWKFKSGMCQE